MTNNRKRIIDYDALRVLGFQKEYVAGLDLGQKQDYSAVALIERTKTVYDARDAYTYDQIAKTEHRLVHAERLPLGTAYPDVVDRVRTLLAAAPGREARALVVDATGVGAAVVDLLRRSNMPGRMVPVTITGGDSVTQDRGAFRVPKRDVISCLQVGFEQRELLLEPGADLVETFIGELMAMRSVVTARGHERIEAWREGQHDDVVLAAGLAWWWLVWEMQAANLRPTVGERNDGRLL